MLNLIKVAGLDPVVVRSPDEAERPALGFSGYVDSFKRSYRYTVSVLRDNGASARVGYYPRDLSVPSGAKHRLDTKGGVRVLSFTPSLNFKLGDRHHDGPVASSHSASRRT